jgi:hypothetical protein
MNRKNRFNEESFAYRLFYPVISVKRSRPEKQKPTPEIPVRICPHCGYKMQTWSGGDISCTRCENDIRKGETRSLRELSGDMGLQAEKM